MALWRTRGWNQEMVEAFRDLSTSVLASSTDSTQPYCHLLFLEHELYFYEVLYFGEASIFCSVSTILHRPVGKFFSKKKSMPRAHLHFKQVLQQILP